MAYELTKELETGNAVIDKEHRELFRAVNELMDACNTGKGRDSIESAIKFLVGYVDKHFAHEEQLQALNKYPDIAAHKAFHAKYKADLKAAVSKIGPGGPELADIVTLNGQVAVLIGHIKVEDKKMSKFLKQS